MNGETAADSGLEYVKLKKREKPPLLPSNVA